MQWSSNLFTEPLTLKNIKINMPKNNRLFFLCTGQAVGVDWLLKHPDSHIIGELVRVMFDETIVTALAYYNVSLPVISPPEKMPPVRMEIVGDAMNITCTCCKRRARWLIGKAAVNHVIKKYAPE
jgi:hypothetical protein